MEFKTFTASICKAPSVDRCSKIFFIVFIGVSDPASCTAHIWSGPADETTSFWRTDTMTFCVILRSFSKSPLVVNFGYGQKGWVRMQKSFSGTAWYFFCANLFDKIFYFLSKIYVFTVKVIWTNNPSPSICIHCRRSRSSFCFGGSFSNHLFFDTCKHHWVDSRGSSYGKKLLLAFFDSGCVSFKLFSVSLLSSSIPSFIVLVSIFNAALIALFI